MPPTALLRLLDRNPSSLCCSSLAASSPPPQVIAGLNKMADLIKVRAGATTRCSAACYAAAWCLLDQALLDSCWQRRLLRVPWTGHPPCPPHADCRCPAAPPGPAPVVVQEQQPGAGSASDMLKDLAAYLTLEKAQVGGACLLVITSS